MLASYTIALAIITKIRKELKWLVALDYQNVVLVVCSAKEHHAFTNVIFLPLCAVDTVFRLLTCGEA